MTTETLRAALPPIGPHDHPEPQVMYWSALEIEWIKRYAEKAVSAALAAPVQEPVAEVALSDAEMLTKFRALQGLRAGEPTPVAFRTWLQGWRDHEAAAVEVAEPQAAPAVPEGAKWLFISLGEQGDPVALTWCADDEAVRHAVGEAMFFQYNPLTLDERDKDIVDGNTEALIEDGFVDFEGDPGLRLYRLAARPQAGQGGEG